VRTEGSYETSSPLKGIDVRANKLQQKVGVVNQGVIAAGRKLR
jgi:hypothetical protein